MTYKYAPVLGNTFFSTFYDLWMNLFGVGNLLQKKTLKLIKIKDDQNLVDIGCGTGTLAVLIKTTYPHVKVFGIDPDIHILEVARRKAKKEHVVVDFIKAPAEKLPFQKNSCDIVISSLAFHHLPTEIKKQALHEVFRVLRPKGKFYLIDIGKLQNLFWKMFLFIESFLEPREYVKDNLMGRLPEYMQDASFNVKELRPSYRGIQFLLAVKQ